MAGVGVAENSDLPKMLTPEELKQQAGELIAAYEIAMDRLAQREKALENQFEFSEKFLNDQLEKINALMIDLREIMTEAGAARWRLSAQDALKLGDLQLDIVKKLSEDTQRLMNESAQRFERTSQSTTKNIHDAVNMFKVEEFKQYTEHSCEEIKKTASSAMEKINEILNWFQWRNLVLVLGLSIIAAVVIGLYIDDEWPWELHETVIRERAAGQALMNAWPHLDAADQRYLEEKLLESNRKNK